MTRAWLLAPLLLAACSGGHDADGNQDMGNSAEIVGNNMLASPDQVPTPPAPAPVQASASATLPAAFVGRWGMVPGDCTSDRGDGKGLMTIAADSIAFYESRATPGDIRIVSPSKVVATLAFSGEGETWRRETSLTLTDEGRTLVREERDPPQATTYMRCPS